MNTSTIILLVFLISTFSILPGIAMAMESHNSPVKDFFIGALFVPVLGAWSGLTVFVLFAVPDSIMNSNWGFVIFFAIFICMPVFGAFILIAIITKYCK